MIELKCNMNGEEKELTVNAEGNFPELVADLGVSLAWFLKAVDRKMGKGPSQTFRDVFQSKIFLGCCCRQFALHRPRRMCGCVP